MNTPAAKNSRRVNYAYVVLTAAFFIMVLVYGSQYCFGVFFKPMISDFGWSRAATSGAFSIFMLVTGLLSLISGRLSDKIGTRKVIIGGSVLLGVGYMLTSQTTDLWQLYVFYGIIAAAGTSTMYVPVVSLVTRWFPGQTGLMSGIGISGIGLGIGIVPVFANWLVNVSDWQNSMFIVGIASMVAILLLALCFKEPGLLAFSDIHEGKNFVIDKEFGFFEAWNTGQFWMFCLAWFCYGFIYQVGIVHIVPHATDVGMSATAGATVLTTIGVIGIPGRILLGISGDRFGNCRTFIVSYAVIGIVYLGLMVGGMDWVLYTFGVIFGFLTGVGILLAPITAEYFGYKSLGTIVGGIFFFFSIGGAVSPWLAGSIFDITGSYQLAFLSCGIIGIIAAFVMLKLEKPRKYSKK